MQLSRRLVFLPMIGAGIAAGTFACGFDGVASLDAASPDASPAPSDGGRDMNVNSASDSSVPREAGHACALDGGTEAGTLCAGKCVDIARDHENCGGCGLPCAGAAACEGSCVDVATALAPFRYEIACTNTGDPFCSMASRSAPRTVTLTGTSGRSYVLAIHIRGVVEQKAYANPVAGSAQGTKANFFIVGGAPANDFWNTFSLQVSAPAKTAYLNSGASNHDYVDAIDYRALLSANAGAAVTLNAASTDDLMARNRDQAGAAIVIPGIKPAPAAFDGQFIQVDIDSVSLAP